MNALIRQHAIAPVCLILLFAAFALDARAVIFYSTGDTTLNTTVPGDGRSVPWDLQGTFNDFLGTPIASEYFITAKHIGGSVGNVFSFAGGNYTTISYTDNPSNDLRIWKVSGTLPSFASLYAGTDEVGKELFVTGRGTQRGSEVNVTGASPTDLRGWQWGTSDKMQRWGENHVDSIEGSGAASRLYASFSRSSTLDYEAHLSVGDSGGAVFIQESGTWKLAGINYAVDAYFNTANRTTGEFNAAIFDAGGLYFGNDADGYSLITDTTSDKSSGFYSTRISASTEWIGTVIPEPSSVGLLLFAACWATFVRARHRTGKCGRVESGSIWESAAQPDSRGFE